MNETTTNTVELAADSAQAHTEEIAVIVYDPSELAVPRTGQEAHELNLAIVAAAYSNAGCTELTLEFQGSSGERYTWDFGVKGKPHDLVEFVDIFSHDSSNDQWVLKSSTLEDAVDGLAKTIIDDHHSNFEDDDGGGGALTIHLNDGTWTLERYEYVEEQVDALGMDFRSLLGGNTKLASRIEGVTNHEEAHAYTKEHLFDAIKKAGGSYVNIEYRGSGDSGDTWDVESDIIDRDRRVTVCASESAWASGINQITFFPVELNIFEAIDQFAWELQDRYHSGYENNDGGGGTIVLDLRDREALWSGYNNSTERKYMDEMEGTFRPLRAVLAEASTQKQHVPDSAEDRPRRARHAP